LTVPEPLQSTPHPRVVESLDVIEDIGSRISARVIVASIDAFSLERAKEAFDEGVVGAAADGAHAAHQVVALQKALVFVALKLAAAI
jgi:hypothetical protein